jgi:hypothetical protein
MVNTLLITLGVTLATCGAIDSIKEFIQTKIKHKILKDGSTHDKDRLLKAFDYYVKHTKNPVIWVTCNCEDSVGYCKSKFYDITKDNIDFVKECILSQEWNKIFGTDPEIDFKKLKTINGKYSAYVFFNLDYCM